MSYKSIIILNRHQRYNAVSFCRVKGQSAQKKILILEHPHPGVSGRHRKTRTYGARPDFDTSPRDELVKDILDIKNIYKSEGLYTYEMKKSLLKAIDENKKKFPDVFKK